MEKQKSTELQIIPVELNQVVETTKIELSKAEGHAMAFAPSMGLYIALADEIKSLNKLEPSENDAKKAREARLKMVKVRTGAEEIKDQRKEGIRAEGDLIQALFNVVKNSCLVTENEFTEIEKHQERIEAKRQSDLAEARTVQLAQYGTDTTYLPLGIMTDEQFDRLLENEGLAFTARKEAAEKAEQARIDAERVAEEARVEQLRLQAERIEAERLEAIRIKEELAAKEAELEAERKSAKITADKLAKENEAKLVEQKRLADIEAKKQADELAKQKAEADKLVEALRIQQLADEEKQRQFAKAEQDRVAKEQAALIAPDKEKINALYKSIQNFNMPEFKSKEALELGRLVAIELDKICKLIKVEAQKLK